MAGAAGAPVTTLTGADIQQLMAYMQNLVATFRQNGLNSAGLTDNSALGIGTGFSPNLAMQALQASRDQASANYGLDLQRYGLDYANTAFNQKMAVASQQAQLLDLQTRRSGPEDWLRYNYVINNKPGAPEPTVGASGTTALPSPTVGAGAPQGAPGMGQGQLQLGAPQPNGDAQAKAAALSELWNKGDFAGFHAAGGGAATPSDPWGQSAPAAAQAPADTQPGVNGTQGADWTPGLTNPDNGQQQAGGYTWDPEGSGGPHLLAFGGKSTRQPGGVHAAVVGDPQRGKRANPELAMSAAPIFVKPLQGKNAAGAKTKAAAKRLPHFATGGVTGAEPFISKVTGQDPSGGFGARGEALGAYGTAPVDYNKYLQLLPSEQAMTKGYIETPKDQGGLGGWFPDELERGRRASFSGLQLGSSSYAA